MFVKITAMNLTKINKPIHFLPKMQKDISHYGHKQTL